MNNRSLSKKYENSKDYRDSVAEIKRRSVGSIYGVIVSIMIIVLSRQIDEYMFGMEPWQIEIAKSLIVYVSFLYITFCIYSTTIFELFERKQMYRVHGRLDAINSTGVIRGFFRKFIIREFVR